MEQGLSVFENKKIRKTWNNNEWWFSVVDIVGALTDSVDSKDYWYRIKKRELDEGKIELSTVCRQLKLESSDGKKYETDCTNTEGAFRIIQSIPSPKAEPFKLWLAKTGYERVQENETLNGYHTYLASEKSLGKLWNTKKEDNAWKHLENVPI